MTSAPERDDRPVRSELLKFIDGVVGNEDKTRRLGVLMCAAGVAVGLAVAPALAIITLVLFKAPIWAKFTISGGSIALSVLGTFSFTRLRRARNRRKIEPITTRHDAVEQHPPEDIEGTGSE